MFQNKTDTSLFLLYISILIFAEKIFDYHHAYNKRSEIIHMNLITCLNITLLNKIWRSISNGIFTCRILGTLRSIVPAITQKKLSNKFLENKADWNILKV